MRATWIGGCAVMAMALGAGANAQTQSQPQSPATGGYHKGSDKASTITVTGCLQPDQSASGSTASSGSPTGTAGAGTTGSAGSTASSGSTASARAGAGADRFILTNAHSGSSSASGSPSATTGSTGSTGSTATGSTSSGTAGTTGGSMSEGAGSTYTLEGSTGDLRKHVGHEVEVTGKLDTKASGSSTATATTGQRLNVKSVKMISSSCSSK
jgi:hypothetical protein